MGQVQRSSVRGAAILGAALIVLCGCQTIAHHTRKELPKDSEARRVIVLPPDVQLSVLHAGGLEEPNAEWTRNARSHIAAELDQKFRTLNVSLVSGQHISGNADNDAKELQLLKLHEAVGRSILVHQYQGPLQLPTKATTFNWSLGPETAHLRRKYGGDYALFVFVRDSYASAERIATMIIAAAVFGVGIQGGVQVGFASLVDLNTGEVVWFNRLVRAAGDLRTADAAKETVTLLMTDFPK